MSNEDQRPYHEQSRHNVDAISNADYALCYYCVNGFNPQEHKMRYVDNHKTALCPFCDIDAVILPPQHSEKHEHGLFLARLRQAYFGY